MSSTQLRSLEIATETNFCGLSSSYTSPNVTGLTFYAVDYLDLSQLLVDGEPLANDPSGMKGGSYSMPARPIYLSNATPVRGSLSFDFYLRGWESTDPGIVALLKTRFNQTSSASVTTSTISTATTSTQAVTASAAINTAAGGVCMALHNDVAIYGYVCAYSSGTSFTATPNIVSRGAATSDKINGCWTLALPTAGLPATTSTVAIKITGQGWTQTLMGCSLTSLTMNSSSDSRGVRCTATVDVAYVSFATSGTPKVIAADATTGVLSQLASPLGLGEVFALTTGSFGSGAAATTSSAFPSICVDEWSLSVEFSTAFSSCGSYMTGRSKSETTSVTATLELTLGDSSTFSVFKSQWVQQKARTAILGFNGVDDNGDTIGGAIVFPAAVVSEFNDALDMSSDFVRTKVTLAAGPCPISTQPSFVLALRN